MKKFNYVLAILSLVVGITLAIFSFAIEGLSTALGVILGMLLIVNGGLRLWLLQSQKKKQSPQ